MNRSCGSCTLCCTVQGIKEGMPGTPNGEKLPNMACPYAKTHAPSCGGCTIYETRPQECVSYQCMWLGGFGGSGDRPDKLGVLFEVYGREESEKPYVGVRTLRRGLEKNPRVQRLIAGLRGQGVLTVAIHPEDVKGWVTEFEIDEETLGASRD